MIFEVATNINPPWIAEELLKGTLQWRQLIGPITEFFSSQDESGSPVTKMDDNPPQTGSLVEDVKSR